MKDHWEWKTEQDVAGFLREQERRLGYPTRKEMQDMTSPTVSDSVISQAYLGQLDPKNCKARTLAGLKSIANAKAGKAIAQPRVRQKCTHCGGSGYID